jgi:hypothetical protein
MKNKRIQRNKIGPEMYIRVIDGGHVLFYSFTTAVALKLNNGKYIRTEKCHSTRTQQDIDKWLDGSEFTKMSQEWFDEVARLGVLLSEEPGGRDD